MGHNNEIMDFERQNLVISSFEGQSPVKIF